MPERYGIAEWYGVPLDALSAAQRSEFSAAALRGRRGAPSCPFQEGAPPCRKSGGVCSLRRYEQGSDGRLGAPVGEPVIFCPSRFEESGLLVRWLAEIVGFAPDEAMVAREVPLWRARRRTKRRGRSTWSSPRRPTARLRGTGWRFRRCTFREKACGRNSRVWGTRARLRRFQTPSAGRIGARQARSV